MKTYVIMLSKKFPKSHQCAGDETHFIDYIYIIFFGIQGLNEKFILFEETINYGKKDLLKLIMTRLKYL